MKKILVSLTLLFLIVYVVLDYFYLNPFDKQFERYYKEKLLVHPMISEVTNYLNYEGTVSVTLILNDKKELVIWGIGLNSFIYTNTIGLVKVNGKRFTCRNESDQLVKINILDFINSDSRGGNIHSIYDLIDNFEKVESYISTFSTDKAKQVLVNNVNLHCQLSID